MKKQVLINFKYSTTDIYPYDYKTKKIYFNYDNDTTFKDLSEKLNLGEYPLIIKTTTDIGGTEYYYHFDYIYGENHIIWDENIYDVKIVDYLRTFKCNSIDVEKASGGIGDVFVALSINQVVKSIIDMLSAISKAGEFGAGLYFFIEMGIKLKKYVKAHRNNGKYIDGRNYMYSILLNSDWNLSDFMTKYHFNKRKAKKLLKILGYEYIKTMDVYHISSKQKKKDCDIISTVTSKIKIK